MPLTQQHQFLNFHCTPRMSKLQLLPWCSVHLHVHCVAERYDRAGHRISSHAKLINDGNSICCGLVKCFLRMDSVCYAVIKPTHVLSVEIEGTDFNYILRHQFPDSVDGLLDCEVVPMDQLKCVLFKLSCDDGGFYLMEPLTQHKLFSQPPVSSLRAQLDDSFLPE